MTSPNLASVATEFMLCFVRESNEIEDVAIPDSDLLAGLAHGRGHMGALADALRLAENGELLTAARLCQWQSAIAREQLRYGHWIADEHIGRLRPRNMRMGQREFAPPEEIEPALNELLTSVNSASADTPYEVLRHTAWTHWRFELIHPFVDGNGRTGRLLSLYQLRSARALPVLFTAGDRDTCYFKAFEPASPDAMVRYFQEHAAEKMSCCL